VAITLSPLQQDIVRQITNYGAEHGFSASDIAIAIKTAYIESSLGANVGTPPPAPGNEHPTASGLYQYTNETWKTSNGDKNSIADQISAFYGDLATYRSWYNDPALNGNIPRDQIDLGEYVYIKHHDGRSFTDFLNAPGLTYWHGTSFVPEVNLSNVWDKFKASISDFFQNLQNTVYRIVWITDPLVLDLNGDGIHTVGVNGANSVYFDQDGDGIKTATGWVKSDDGFLVLDRNGNGLIDNGSELFGDNTALSTGEQAAEGFAALADQDSNQDGVINANDANFANLRVWRDLNQDGVSQTNELFTLDAAGVQSVNLANTQVNQALPDGNGVQRTASFTRTDGSTGQVADLELKEDAFYREFTTAVPVSAAIAALPNMSGSGRLRDLREAA
jgi:hypothetical protein